MARTTQTTQPSMSNNQIPNMNQVDTDSVVVTITNSNAAASIPALNLNSNDSTQVPVFNVQDQVSNLNSDDSMQVPMLNVTSAIQDRRFNGFQPLNSSFNLSSFNGVQYQKKPNVVQSVECNMESCEKDFNEVRTRLRKLEESSLMVGKGEGKLNELRRRKESLVKEAEKIEGKADSCMNVLFVGMSFFFGFFSMMKCSTIASSVAVIIMSLLGIAMLGILTILRLKVLNERNNRVIEKDETLKSDVHILEPNDYSTPAPPMEEELSTPFLQTRSTSFRVDIDAPLAAENFSLQYVLPASVIGAFSFVFALVLLSSAVNSCRSDRW